MDNNNHNHEHSHHDKMETKRIVEYLNNTIEIETTYNVKVNGKNYKTHILLGEDGVLTTHAIPYVTFASMTDLIKGLIKLYPNEFHNH